MALESLKSNILPGTSAGIPDAPTEKDTGALTTVKAPTSKGGFNVGSVALDPTNSAEILANMQKFIDERKMTGFDKFSRGIDRAILLGHDPRSLIEYDKEDERKAKDLMDMQNQMGALKAAQAMQARLSKQVEDEYNAAHPQAGAAQSATNAVAPASGDNMPEAMWRDYKLAKDRGDYAGAEKVLSDWRKYTSQEGFKARTGFENSGPGRTQQSYTVNTPDGTIQIDLDPVQWANVQATGKLPNGTPVLPAGPTATAPRVATPAPVTTGGIQPTDIRKVESNNTPFAVGPNVPGQGTAKSSMQVMDATSINPGFGVKPAQLTGNPVQDEAERTRVGTEYFTALKSKYGNDTLASIAYNMGPGATDKWIAAGANINALPAETRDYVAKAHIASATANAAPTAAPAAAPTAAPAAAAGVGANEQRAQAFWDTHPPRNKNEFDKRKSDIDEARKADVALESAVTQKRTEAKLAGTTKENEKSGEAAARMEDLARHADSVSGSADQILGHAKTHPEEFAFSQQPGAKGMVLSGIEAVSPTLEHGVEKVIQAAHPGRDESGQTMADRRNKTTTAAGNLGFAAAAELFAGSGARLGVGLEQMVAKAKGVGTEHTAQTNIMNATLIKMAAQKSKELAPAWAAYKNSKPAGEADYYTFLQTDPAAQFIDKKWDPAFKQWLDKAKTEAPNYYNDLTNKPSIKSFYKQKNG